MRNKYENNGILALIAKGNTKNYYETIAKKNLFVQPLVQGHVQLVIFL